MIETHQAWQFQGAGKALALGETSLPEPGNGQLLVRNLAIGINPVDWKFIEHDPRKWPLGHVPGVDGVGIVIRVGSEQDEALLGETVAYHHRLSENGSFAEHCLVYAARVMRVPPSLGAKTAAALPCPMLTAWQAFSKIPQVQGAKVLVTGMGAVNKMLVQLLSGAGFEVHALSGSVAEQQAQDLGVKQVFRAPPVEGSYFALFDANGPEAAKSLVPLLQANGHVTSILGRIEQPVDAPFTRTISYHEIALGALHEYGDEEQWARLMKDGERFMTKVATGSMKLDAPRVFDFQDLNAALQFSREQKHKAVVKLSH